MLLLRVRTARHQELKGPSHIAGFRVHKHATVCGVVRCDRFDLEAWALVQRSNPSGGPGFQAGRRLQTNSGVSSIRRRRPTRFSTQPFDAPGTSTEGTPGCRTSDTLTHSTRRSEQLLFAVCCCRPHGRNDVWSGKTKMRKNSRFRRATAESNLHKWACPE